MANFEKIDLGELLEESTRLEAQQPGNAGNSDFLENFVCMPQGAGNVVVRLLPPAVGKKFYCATRTHRLDDRNLHCPRELVNVNGKKRWVDMNPKKPCPICKFYSDLWKKAEGLERAGDKQQAEILKDKARAIKPIERYYYNVFVRRQVNRRGELENNVGPKILSIGKTLHERIVRALVGNPANDIKPIGPVVDFKEGRDFRIIKTLKGGYANYDTSEWLDPAPLGESALIKELLENLHDLQSLRRVKDNDELKTELQKYLGVIEDNDDTDYNPADFEVGVKTNNEESVSSESKSESKPEPKPQSKAEAKFDPDIVMGDEALDTDDILNELKDLEL